MCTCTVVGRVTMTTTTCDVATWAALAILRLVYVHDVIHFRYRTTSVTPVVETVDTTATWNSTLCRHPSGNRLTYQTGSCPKTSHHPVTVSPGALHSNSDRRRVLVSAFGQVS